MLTRHVSNRLTRYCDGELTAAETLTVDTHLAACPRCRTELEGIRFAARVVRQLSTVSAPPSVWNGIDSALSEPGRPRMPIAGLQWAFVCLVLVAAAGSGYWWMRTSVSRPWQVATLADGGATTRMAPGEWIETDVGVRRRIVVGDIGTVDVEPATRVQLGAVGPSEYRLALARGTIRAQIAAPPRLFIVDTPASTIVDLGCAYTVTVADDGGSGLRMTEGWAALEWKGLASLVPAGAVCRTRPGLGPGTPYFEDAPAALRQAVDAFDAGGDRTAALDGILREARVRDTLTLWHLLSRVEADQRSRVYDRIAGLTAPPPTISRERALRLDQDTLRLLREELAWKW